MPGEYIEPIERLAESFRRLEGIGRKTALRLAVSALDLTDEEIDAFAQAVSDIKTKIHFCPVCQNLSVGGKCAICEDARRDARVVCVVEDVKAVMAMERVKEFNGLYHVLHGVISPMRGITPDHIKIKELLARLEDGTVEEVILATNPTVEGEATAMYLSRLLRPLGIRVSRLAYGVPVGGDLECADEVTLYRALEGRREL